MRVISSVLILISESGFNVKSGEYSVISTFSLLAFAGAEKILPKGEEPNHSPIVFIILEKKSVMPDPPISIDETNSNAANDAARILQSNIILSIQSILINIRIELIIFIDNKDRIEMNSLILAQIGIGGGEWYSWIMWIVFMVVFFMFYPRLMLSQIMWKLERVAKELEIMSERSKEFIIKEIAKKPEKTLKNSVNRFFEFFMIQPVSLDPYGIVRKFDHLIQGQKDRFDYFVKQIAPKMPEEKQACIKMGFAGGIALHEVAKIVRHYVELVKKTKSIQIAMILQMQLPLIERIAKSLARGTKALARGKPIGDGLGPLVIADLIGNTETKEIEEDILMARIKMEGRNVFVLKARGPGGRIGRPGKAVEKLINQNRITRMITIDAAAKLEGEKTGSLAEGVGVAMGGPGVERSYIEDIVVKKNIPLDSIIVKMGQEEAIEPMRKAIKDALPEVRESIKRSIARVKRGDNVIIVGVGNTSGVGNSGRDVKKVAEWVDKYERKLQAQKKKK